MADPVYLDHQSATPVDPRVRDAMLPWFGAKFGHPAARSHAKGWEAEEAVEGARARVADLIRAEPAEVVFTSGSTEADNLAVKGVVEAYEGRGRHVVTTTAENRAIHDVLSFLELKRGVEVARVPVDRGGRVDPAAVGAAVRPDTVLVSVHAANAEIGTLQPLREVAAACAGSQALVHTDASYAVPWVPVDVRGDGLHLVTLTSDLLGGPQGVGALYVRRRDPRVRIAPQTHGGAHERGLRAGTLPVALVVGFGAAADLVRRERDGASERVRALRDDFESAVLSRVAGVHRHGDPEHRLPSTSNLSFDGVEAEALLLGMPDVMASSAAACTSALVEPSYVLTAIGASDRETAGSVRFSLGPTTTADEVARAVERVVTSVARVRSVSRPTA